MLDERALFLSEITHEVIDKKVLFGVKNVSIGILLMEVRRAR